MPDLCLYCGEKAVVEESVDGGREQLICIECGSLATQTKAKPENFFEDDLGGVGDQNDNIHLSNSRITFPCQTNDLDPDSSDLCKSCGEPLDDKSSKKKLCSICAEFSEGEEEEVVTKSENQSPLNIPSSQEIVSKPREIFSSPKCSSCGGINLSLDSLGGDERLVCTDCGMVNSESVLTTDAYNPDSWISSKYHVPALPRFADRPIIQKGLLVGLDTIKNLSSKFCFPSSIQTQSGDMYRHVFHLPKVLHLPIVKKVNIAAMCLFIVCRQNDLPISLTLFKSQVEDFSSFLKAKKYILKILNLTLPHVSMSRKASEVLDRLKFDQHLIEKVKDILFLFRRAWLTQGMHRDGLVALAGYYAYVSSDKCKQFLSRQQFLTRNNLPQLSQNRCCDCEAFLLKLARALPWIKQNQVTAKTLPLHIDNILQFQETLIHRVFKSDDEEEDTTPNILQDAARSGNAKSNDNKRHLSTSSSPKEKLLPLAFKKPKRCVVEEIPALIPSDINLDSPTLQEDEFGEEIDSYILSPEEQQNVRRAKLAVIDN